MQTCQAAAGLTLHRLPFSPWANQTELWEGHPRLWCLCRRGNSAWQLLAFRQQPVFMEIIPPYSRCSRLLLITARMKTKLSFFCFLSFFFFFLFSCFRSQYGQPRISTATLTSYGLWQLTLCFEVIHSWDQYKLRDDICFLWIWPNTCMCCFYLFCV